MKRAFKLQIGLGKHKLKSNITFANPIPFSCYLTSSKTNFNFDKWKKNNFIEDFTFFPHIQTDLRLHKIFTLRNEV